MAAMDKDRITYEGAFMTKYWQLRKHFAEPDGTDEYWEGLLDNADKLLAEFNNDEYVSRMLLLLVADAEMKAQKYGMKAKWEVFSSIATKGIDGIEITVKER